MCFKNHRVPCLQTLFLGVVNQALYFAAQSNQSYCSNSSGVPLLPLSALFVSLQHSWKLIPKQGGLLSAVEYSTRQIEFEVAVVSHIQQDRPEDEDEKVFKNPFEINFQVKKRKIPTSQIHSESAIRREGGPLSIIFGKRVEGKG